MNTSLWQRTNLPRFPKVKQAGHYDVIVIGGGITGLTTSYLLNRSGKRVCLLERDRLAGGDTAHTTAHLTQVTDCRLTELVKHFGKDQACLVWQGGAAAIKTIAEIAQKHEIDCQFRRVPGFLHAPLLETQKGDRDLRVEADCALELGFDARFLTAVPYFDKPGVRYSNQAKFHPLLFLQGLANYLATTECEIYEHTEVTAVEDKPLAVQAGDVKLTCDYVVVATHVPLMGKTGLVKAATFQTKLASYSSYVVGAKVPRGLLPEASFWDTSDPYFYLRVDAGQRGDYAIFGGADHKTGQVTDTDKSFADVEKVLTEFVPQAKVDRRWSGQVIETNDGLPFIGETADRQFIATGFSGNGMTFGVLAAMMACDRITGRSNPWEDLFSPARKKLRGGTWDYLKENVDYPYYLVRDRISPPDQVHSTRAVKRGEGRIVKVGGQRVACSRDDKGKLTAVSAVCTHMGCLVRWNGAEQTWDCPCHGSRFRPDGEVLAGPAETPLEPVAIGRAAEVAANGQSGKLQRPHSERPKKDRVSTERQSR